MSEETAEAELVPRKKAKDSIQQLSEIRRGLIHHTVAQYGTPDDPIYVMNVVVDGMEFQGVGPSKKRAKIMASEFALSHLGHVDADQIQTPPQIETGHVNDFTADICTGLLYFNFVSPQTSAAEASLQLPKYQPEDLVASEELYAEDPDQDAFQIYVGRNAVSIMSELRPDAVFELVPPHRSNPTYFLTRVRVRGHTYQGKAPSKKVSKGRAAAAALYDLYGVEFSQSEDGMPVYEGSSNMWESYKEKIEKEAELISSSGPVSVVNPVEHINEMFPEATFEFPGEKSGKSNDGFFRAQFTICGQNYEGIGMSKRDAKANAAANALEAVEKSGELGKRRADMEAKRKQKQTDKGENEPSKQEKANGAPSGGPRNATSRLNELYPSAEFEIIGETPLRNTSVRAFVSAVKVDGERSYVGVGKSKRLAKLAAAEKALKELGCWTVADEAAKQDRMSANKPSGNLPPPAPLMGGAGAGMFGAGAGQFGAGMRGRGGPNMRMGRGRGFGGFGGPGMEQGFGDEPGLDMMIGELGFLVGEILTSNPLMGVTDVWGLLQQNAQYKSWRSGADLPAWQGYQSFADPSEAEYYEQEGYGEEAYYGGNFGEFFDDSSYATQGGWMGAGGPRGRGRAAGQRGMRGSQWQSGGMRGGGRGGRGRGGNYSGQLFGGGQRQRGRRGGW